MVRRVYQDIMATPIYTDPADINRVIHAYTVLKKPKRRIAKEEGVDVQVIYRLLKNQNVPSRGNVRYSHKRDYFRVIDTEAKAYFLGLFFADGCILDHWGRGQRQMSIGLTKQDSYLIERFRQELEYTGPIYEMPYYGTEYDNLHSLRIISEDLCTDLGKLGATSRKSLTLAWLKPDTVPHHLMHHFIRGFMDGDGWTSVCQGKTEESWNITIGFCGTQGFLTGLNTHLSHAIGVSADRKVGKDRTKQIYRLAYTGNHLAYKIAEYLYKDATICMERKRDKLLFTNPLSEAVLVTLDNSR